MYMKLNATKWIELEIIIALTIIIALNAILFSNLSAGERGNLITFSGVHISSLVYGIYIWFSIACLILNKKKWLRSVFIGLLSFMVVHILSNLYLLIRDPKISDNGGAILTDAMLIWAVNLLVFALYYWIVDRGGPIARINKNSETRYDLLFPQYQTKIPGWDNWRPRFLDYLFFSFFTSTGFSPADTLPLSKRVKFLMMLEAFVSLIIIGMVASRAISLIQ